MLSIKLPLLLPLPLSIRATSLIHTLRRVGGRATAFAQDVAQDRSGAVAVTLALSLTGIVGFAALATEGAQWYQIHRTMQGAADSAAYAAATAKSAGAAVDAYTAQAKAIAGDYGYVDASNGVVVTVNNPPLNGNYAGDANAVEVLISRPQPLVLTGMFVSAAPTIGARAVATVAPTGCVLALDTGSVNDMDEVGNTTVNLNDCDLYINSSSPTALTMKGAATINAEGANISGNYTTSGQSSLNAGSSGVNLGVPPAGDPYADVQIPPYGSCDQTNYQQQGGYRSFQPNASGTYVFCNGLSVTGNGTIALASGTYVIKGGTFSIGSGSTLSGTGVTIILTGNSSSGYATADIEGSPTINLTAPTSGPLAGIAIFQDRNAPASGTNKFAGGATQNITGAIYIPSQSVTFAGGVSAGGSRCTQLVARTLKFGGNTTSTFNNKCTGTGVRGIGTSFVQVVE